MDLVTIIAACAIGLRSELFVTLGLRGDCARAAAAGIAPPLGSESASIDRWAAEISAAAARFNLPERILRAVMGAESGGHPNATSPAGAIGLMQLMPKTWAVMRARYGLGPDPYAPADNVMAGTAFIRELIDRYGAPDFLAAYNAGPARLEEHRLRGRPLPDETRQYVARLASVVGSAPPVDSTAHRNMQAGGQTRIAGWESERASTRTGTRQVSAKGGLFVLNERQLVVQPLLHGLPLSRGAGAAQRTAVVNDRGIFVQIGADDLHRGRP